MEAVAAGLDKGFMDSKLIALVRYDHLLYFSP